MEHAFRKVLALADAELSPAEVPALIQELSRNPPLVRALQSYMAVGRNRIAKVYASKSEEPVPQWLVDTIMHAPLGAAESPPFNIVSFGRALLGRVRAKYSIPGWSLAAGPAVAAGLAVVSAWLLVPAATQGETLLSSQLQHSLETAPSAQDAPLLTFRPIITYLSKEETYCRQFEMRSGGERSFAVACRAPTGKWDVAAKSGPSPIGTAPAASAREELDRFVTSHSSTILDDEQADEAMRNGWNRSPTAASPAPSNR